MGFTWKRPENIPFPSVWFKFKARDLNTDELVEYVVQDLPTERNEEAIELMTSCFLEDEPMFKSTEMSKDLESVKAMQQLWTKNLEQKVTLVCFKEGSKEIIGLNFLSVELKEDQSETYSPQGEKWKYIFKGILHILDQFNVFDYYNVDKYLTGNGLLVDRKYRGRGIGEQILRARIPLTKAVAVSVTSNIFSATGSQKLAVKAGFELNYEITYDDLAYNEPFVSFPGVETKYLKVMSIKL